MFFIDLNYLASFEEVSVYMEVHLNHLKKYYDEKIFVMWGPKVPRTGGVIMAFASSREQIEQIITEDPFYQHKLAEFDGNVAKAAESMGVDRSHLYRRMRNLGIKQ